MEKATSLDGITFDIGRKILFDNVESLIRDKAQGRPQLLDNAKRAAEPQGISGII